MTDVDEGLLTAAKLFEQATDELDGGADVHPHAALVRDPEHRRNLSFLQDVEDVPPDLLDTVTRTMATDVASDAVHQGNGTQLSHMVGITETDLRANGMTFAMELNKQLENNDAPAFVLAAGNPNTGKTNTMALLAELRRAALEDDLLIVSNIRSLSSGDLYVSSAHDLAVTLLEHRETPKFVIIDEGSTHFDARTYRREVAQQFTPLAKRFAKMGVDVFGTIGHTGKDVHPEVKRLTTLGLWKVEKKVAELYERWPADSDQPADQFFGGPVEDIPAARSDYSADDAAPWSWDLNSELFSEDLGWDELLGELHT